MAGLHLSTEEDEIMFDDALTEDSNVSVELCLVGRFLTEQPIIFNLMRSRLASVWRPGKGVFMKDIGQGRFIFQFFHEIDLQRVYDGGPWAFGNFPLILHRLEWGEFPLSVPLDVLPFWVQIHDLPAGYLSEGVGKLLENFIGKFMEYDSSNFSGVWRQYTRIRVGVCVTEPIKRFKRIKKKDGSSFVVNFKYERLNVFCFLCGRLGHSESFCKLMFNSATKDTVREWGMWLKAADRRAVSLAGDKWLRSDKEEGNPIHEGVAARVVQEPLQTAPKRKEQENLMISLIFNENLNSGNKIPIIQQWQALQDISHAYHGQDSTMIDESSLAYVEERKHRCGATSADCNIPTSSESLPAGVTEDISDDQIILVAGSGYGVGRVQ
ncbi:uncharacterized protein LOC131025710 [Salvia miltiorrhiza]|uniref:uncharacterized protein LOC131025710 n=1 Tax=Salvia miltiorrhiza TaxID=226208 RepID=UPI0025ACC7B2|nr:uncharacterized protein LOC131025710 [Salvia miltiorrhiza]